MRKQILKYLIFSSRREAPFEGIMQSRLKFILFEYINITIAKI
jgi:hypothetical protein